MTKGIYGITNMQINYDMHDATRISLELVAAPNYDAFHLQNEKWDELFPGNAIVKCGHCGQWGARKTACKYCGAPID